MAATALFLAGLAMVRLWEGNWRPVRWRTLHRADPWVELVLTPGEDLWGLRWSQYGRQAFFSYSDKQGNHRDSFLIDLATRQGKEFGDGGLGAAEYFQSQGMESMPSGTDPRSSGVVEVDTPGPIRDAMPAYVTQAAFTSRSAWNAPYLGLLRLTQGSTYSGPVRLREPGGRLLLAQDLLNVIPATLRMSLSPDKRFLAYIDGAQGDCNHIWIWKLKEAPAAIVQP